MKTSELKNSRKNFLRTVIPIGAGLCFGCPKLLFFSRDLIQDQDFSLRIKKEKLSFSHEEFFIAKFNDYIDRMKKFKEYIGQDKLISMIKRSTDDLNNSIKPYLEAKSVKDFLNPLLNDENYKIWLDIEVLELTDKIGHLKITNCIWAKTFLDRNAGDIGFATICYGDFSWAKAFNPKLKMERTDTLMEGYKCCDETYIWNG